MRAVGGLVLLAAFGAELLGVSAVGLVVVSAVGLVVVLAWGLRGRLVDVLGDRAAARRVVAEAERVAESASGGAS